MNGTLARYGRGIERERTGPAPGELFTDARRRELLDYLADRESDEAIELDDLARAVAEREYDDVDEEDYQRVLVSLDRTHLPVLADADLAEVDRDDGIFVHPDADALGALV